VGDFLDRLTAPVLNPIRRRLPNFGNIDISPIVAILLLEALQLLLADVQRLLLIRGWYF
jgi:YggT family protein